MPELTRRGFLGSLVGGIATLASVRTFPFRVFSFPSEIVIPSGNQLLTISMINREALRVLENNLVFANSVRRDFDADFTNSLPIGSVLNIRRPSRFVLNA